MKEKTIVELQVEVCEIWPQQFLTLRGMVVLLAVIQGDLARQARNGMEDCAIDRAEVAKELGNLVLSSLRWMDNLGLDADECLKCAMEAQKSYIEKLKE